ncbi:MAG: hypothetical protein H5T80_04605, partial [Dietzia sp.]|nr:hypothetical protein [Dietzia sp.]
MHLAVVAHLAVATPGRVVARVTRGEHLQAPARLVPERVGVEHTGGVEDRGEVAQHPVHHVGLDT